MYWGGVVLLTLLIISGVVSYLGSKTLVLDDVSLKENSSTSDMFSIMIKNSRSSNYKEYTGTYFPTNALFDGDLSGCVDKDGNSVDGILSFNNGYAYVDTSATVYCYLYFYYETLRDAILLAENDTYDLNYSMYYIKSKGEPDFSITPTADEGLYYAEDDYGDSYYFRGAVADNYVYFAGYYWRIIRINGDGSVRMIYDGTKAYNNGVIGDREIGLGYFNSSDDNNAYVGYMYGEEEAVTKGSVTSSTTTTIDVRHYYASGYTFDKATGLYTLSDDATQQDVSDDIIGLYMCKNMETSCYTLYKIDSYLDLMATGGFNVLYYYTYSTTTDTDEEGNTIYIESVSNSTSATQDIFYTFTDYALNTNTTYPYYNYDFMYSESASVYYDVSDSIVGAYTCFSGYYPMCDTLYLVDSVNDDGTVNAYTIRAATYDEVHSNVNDSTIKVILDTWYQKNFVQKEDYRGIQYMQYIADSLFCNDRSLYSGTGVGIDETYYSAYDRIYNNYSPTLKCSQKNDRFTVSSIIGNNDLTYPIALITADEALMAGTGSGNGYLNIGIGAGSSYWTMTPFGGYSSFYAFNFSINPAGNVTSYVPVGYTTQNIRPVINLSTNVLVTGGDGTMDSPYTVALS